MILKPLTIAFNCSAIYGTEPMVAITSTSARRLEQVADVGTSSVPVVAGIDTPASRSRQLYDRIGTLSTYVYYDRAKAPVKEAS